MLKLHSLTLEEARSLLVSEGIPAFRANQLFDWVYARSAKSFEEMNNLPLLLRKRFGELFDLEQPECREKHVSEDGTTKYLLQLRDNNYIECVYLPYRDRRSICVSTQVGCPVGCVFCASCENGFVRNLTCGEIVSQLLFVQRDMDTRLTHVVFMGTGEPLLNSKNVFDAIDVINTRINISQRRMTLSTSGIVRGIDMLAAQKTEITLALSLHSPFQEQRETLIPVAAKNTIDELTESCIRYFRATGRRMTLEYLLLDKVNDQVAAAKALGELALRLRAHVNIIPYNKVSGKSFRRPSAARIRAFVAVLEAKGVPCTQRLERGGGEQAACGQLRNKKADTRNKEELVCATE